MKTWYSENGDFSNGDWSISVGDNGMFIDIYELLKKDNKHPNYFFDKWKSNVIQQLKKDERFEVDGYIQYRIPSVVIKLKEEYRK